MLATLRRTGLALGSALAIAFVLLLAACSSGGGGPAQFNAGVNLNGNWTVTVRTTSVTGACEGETVGATETIPIVITHTGNAIVLDAGTPDETRGTLNGVVARFTGTETTSGVTLTWDITITFTTDGARFSGTVKQSETEAGQTCTVTYDVSGVRSTSSGGVQSYLQGVSAGSTTATAQSGSPPAEGSGPAVGATGPTSVINGGTSLVTLSSTTDGGSPFDAVAISVEGIPDWWLLALPSPTSSVQILIQLGQNIPAANFRCVYQVRAGGQFGPRQAIDITRVAAGTGALQINLSWDTVSDLDLHVVEPTGFEIYYGEPVSPAGGALDVDGNAGCSTSISIENVTYSGVTPPAGEYIVRVDHWENCENVTSNYTVRVNREGQPPVVRTGSFPSTDPGTGGAAGAGVEVIRFTN